MWESIKAWKFTFLDLQFFDQYFSLTIKQCGFVTLTWRSNTKTNKCLEYVFLPACFQEEKVVSSFGDFRWNLSIVKCTIGYKRPIFLPQVIQLVETKKTLCRIVNNERKIHEPISIDSLWRIDHFDDKSDIWPQAKSLSLSCSVVNHSRPEIWHWTFSFDYHSMLIDWIFCGYSLSPSLPRFLVFEISSFEILFFEIYFIKGFIWTYFFFEILSFRDSDFRRFAFEICFSVFGHKIDYEMYLKLQ